MRLSDGRFCPRIGALMIYIAQCGMRQSLRRMRQSLRRMRSCSALHSSVGHIMGVAVHCGPYCGCCSALWEYVSAILFLNSVRTKSKKDRQNTSSFSRVSRATPFRKVSKKYMCSTAYIWVIGPLGGLPIKTDVKNVFLDVLLTKANGLPGAEAADICRFDHEYDFEIWLFYGRLVGCGPSRTGHQRRIAGARASHQGYFVMHWQCIATAHDKNQSIRTTFAIANREKIGFKRKIIIWKWCHQRTMAIFYGNNGKHNQYDCK